MLDNLLALTMDFYAFLSLLLALFSVGLAVLFYFKATDTSNAFYDNTYKFTKDIAELLVRIESGFGERLKHLDENYTRMQDRVYSQPLKEDLEEKQEQVKEEEKNLKQKLEERNKLIEELVQKSQLDEKEKQKFLTQIKSREEQIRAREEELRRLTEQLIVLENQTQEPQMHRQNVRSIPGVPTGLIRYFDKMVLENISPRVLNSNSRNGINSNWKKLAQNLEPAFIKDLQEYGLVDNDENLTARAMDYIRKRTLSGLIKA
jgi:DNA repair exonuclease SbcCD ATPase subunit